MMSSRPTFQTMVRHFALGFGLATVLLLQVATMKAVDPRLLAEYRVVATVAAFCLGTYAALPSGRWLVDAAGSIARRWDNEGETA